MSNPPLYKDIPLQCRFACKDTTIIVKVQEFLYKRCCDIRYAPCMWQDIYTGLMV